MVVTHQHTSIYTNMPMLEYLNEYRSVIHLLLHVLVPGMVALVIAKYSELNAWKVLLILMLTMLVDADHLLADPIYAPNRCSIMFHPLHSFWPMVAYSMMTIWPLVKPLLGRSLAYKDQLVGLVGLGLVIHMVLDYTDCVWMKGVWAISFL